MKIKRGKVILEPGDKVRITTEPKIPKPYLYWNPFLMDEWKGKIVTLDYVILDYQTAPNHWRVKENDWAWDESWFDAVVVTIETLEGLR